MSRTNSIVFLIFLAFASLFLFACGRSSEEEQQGKVDAQSVVERALEQERAYSEKNASRQAAEASSGAEPVYGGRMVTGTIGEPSNLIPALATDSSSHEIADYIYVAPLKYDKDLQLVPYAAESFEILDGGRVLRFKLRQGIRWFDGVELTAEDVKFTYEMMINPDTPTAYAEDYLAVRQFRLIDKYTFEVEYDKPFVRSLVTWAHGIMPKHALENENLLSTKYSRQPLGAGPYKLVKWVPGQQLVLQANEDYFEGRAYIDQVVYRIIPDQSTMFLELKAGNLDMMGLTPQQYLQQTVGPHWEENFNKYEYLSFGYTYLGYNMRNPLFRDVKVRRALTHAINKQEIIQVALSGMGLPAIGPYKPGTWVYNDKLEPYGFDPEKASRMLAEAGWKDSDDDGILDKDKKPFAFTIMTNQGNDMRIKTATIIQQQLKKVGIAVEIRIMEWATFVNEFIHKGDFEAIILGWNILQDPDIYDVWHSSKAVEGGLNHTYYKNKEVDELLEAGRRTLDQEERKRIYDRLQEVLHEEQPYCFLYYPLSLPIVHARFQGIEPAPAGISYNFIRWWVPKDRQRFSLTQ